MSKKLPGHRDNIEGPQRRRAARQIQLHRHSLGLSPEDYGDRIGVSGMTVRRVELSMPVNLTTRRKFADAQNVEVTTLFGVLKLAVAA